MPGNAYPVQESILGSRPTLKKYFKNALSLTLY
jgi:hypothetical protein